MIRAGIAALRAAQLDALAVDATYRHGSSAKSVRAVVGRTVFRSANDYGAWIRTQAWDFIVPEGQLDGEPEAGDVIEFDGDGYEVLAPNGEPAWRWSDPCRSAKRIHTKLTGGES